MASPSVQIPGAFPTENFSSSMPRFPKGPSVFFTTAAVVLALLILEQAVYRSKKASLPGARWTIPIIGKFADSLNPTLEGYKKQWAMGELSAISVFNMSVPS
jgi:C-22 sterol desaturase